MDSQALEQEAEAAELAGGEACLRKVERRPMMCGTFFPGIDGVVQEAAGKSRRRRRKKPLGIEMRMLTEVMKTRHTAGLSAGKILQAYVGGNVLRASRGAIHGERTGAQLCSSLSLSPAGHGFCIQLK